MIKVSTVCLLVGVVMFFTGHQTTMAVALIMLSGLGLVAGIILSNKRQA
jgi:LPXTG-motif cell wall-anchored protein